MCEKKLQTNLTKITLIFTQSFQWGFSEIIPSPLLMHWSLATIHSFADSTKFSFVAPSSFLFHCARFVIKCLKVLEWNVITRECTLFYTYVAVEKSCVTFGACTVSCEFKEWGRRGIFPFLVDNTYLFSLNSYKSLLASFWLVKYQ